MASGAGEADKGESTWRDELEQGDKGRCYTEFNWAAEGRGALEVKLNVTDLKVDDNDYTSYPTFTYHGVFTVPSHLLLLYVKTFYILLTVYVCLLMLTAVIRHCRWLQQAPVSDTLLSLWKLTVTLKAPTVITMMKVITIIQWKSGG